MKSKKNKTYNESFQAADIFDHLDTAVVLLNDQLSVLCLNPAAEILLGVSIKKIHEKPIELLIPNDDFIINSIKEVLATNHPFTRRETSLQLHEHSVIVDLTVQSIQTKNLETQILLEFNQLDRHIRISKEENLLAQNETIRALLRSMAHEVKNPLGGIRGAAQLLEKELDKIPDSPDLGEYTQVIIGEVDRLKNLVNRMLGPNELPNQTMVNIHSVTERVRSLLKTDKSRNVEIFFDYDVSIPEIKIDPEHLIQAVLNIVRNAAQALSEQESSLEQENKIIIKTRVLRHFNIAHKRYKLVVKMDIIDNGPGISEQMQERIFMPLITGRATGTGLGLSIAQSLISQNSGIIECQSKPGKTVFSILLPISQEL
ncbi:MAG: PAS domain-containing protein [Proteobacteria bacterium]|nr:PAS domain-containing protein [Pseudomonadota bacterium]